MSEIVELTESEMEMALGGIAFVIPLIAAGIALTGVAVAAFNSGYTVGKDIAENENK